MTRATEVARSPASYTPRRDFVSRADDAQFDPVEADQPVLDGIRSRISPRPLANAHRKRTLQVTQTTNLTEKARLTAIEEDFEELVSRKVRLVPRSATDVCALE